MEGENEKEEACHWVKKESERQTRIDALQNELQSCEEQLDMLKAEKDGIKTDEVAGILITHKSFGEGFATEYDGKLCSLSLQQPSHSDFVQSMLYQEYLNSNSGVSTWVKQLFHKLILIT